MGAVGNREIAEARLAAAQADMAEEQLKAFRREQMFAGRAASPPAPQGITQDEVNRRFDYHKPSGVAQEFHRALRESAKDFASILVEDLPEGREKSLAMTAFEEATFWAHAAIARDLKLHEETK